MAQKNQNGGTAEDKAPALKGVRRSLQVLEYIALNPGRATDMAAGLEPAPEPDSEYFVGRNSA